MRAGLTLVELLVSLAIVTMLLVVALGVTAALARSELAARRDDAGPMPLDEALDALLRCDLLHAHHWREARDGVAIQTNVRLAPRTLTLEHVPSVVTYQVRKVGERACLVRVQETAPEVPQAELAAMGVRSVRLVPGREVQPGPDGWRPLAAGSTVQVELDPAAPGAAPSVVVVRVDRDR